MTSIAAFTHHGPLNMTNAQLDDFVDHFEEVLKTSLLSLNVQGGKVKCESDFIDGTFGFTVSFTGITHDSVTSITENAIHNLDRTHWEASLLLSDATLKVWKKV